VAFMQETAGSLRAYLFISALLGLPSQLFCLLTGMPLLVFAGVAGIVISLLFVYSDIMLPSLLRTEAGLVIGTLYGGLALAIGFFVYNLAAGQATPGMTALTVVINLYLLSNVKRLAVEAVKAEGGND